MRLKRRRKDDPIPVEPNDAPSNEFAAARGVKLPSEEDSGRLFGDRWPTQKQLKQLTEKKEKIDALSTFRSWLAGRRQALDFACRAYSDESERLKLYEEVIDMHCDGEGLDHAEIARRLGYQSHSFVVDVLEEATAERWHVALHGVPSVAVHCHMRPCKNVIVVTAGMGRPPRFCKDCQAKARELGLGMLVRRRRRPLPAKVTEPEPPQSDGAEPEIAEPVIVEPVPAA